jgi:hypothetical protein
MNRTFYLFFSSSRCTFLIPFLRHIRQTASIDEDHTQKLLEALTVGFLPLCNRLGGLVLSFFAPSCLLGCFALRVRYL